MKKIFTLIAMAAMAIGANAQTWNFSEWEAKEYEETFTKDGLTVTATSGAKVTIDGNNKTVDDVSYTQRLKTGGTGGFAEDGTEQRTLKFDVPGNATIDIILCSASSSEDRTLNVYFNAFTAESKGDPSTTVPAVAGSPVKQTVEYKGEATTITLCSAKSGVNIYAIYVTTAGGTDPTPSDSQPIDLTLEAGTDIGKALATAMETNPTPSAIGISLAAGAYTTSLPIVAGCDITINGNGAEIDASALSEAFIKLADLTEEEYGKKVNITFNDLTISGIPYQLIYANKQQYLMNVKAANSIFGINGAAKKATFDCNGGGNIAHLIIDGCTIYANPAVDMNGGFFTSQSSKAVVELDEAETESKEISNSTLYNITYNRTVNSLRKNSQEYQSYVVKNCIIVNCGKKGQFLKGLNAGQAGKTGNWDVNGNIFNFDGEDISAEETVVDGVTLNNIPGVVTFSNPETGDFNYNVKVSEGVSVPEKIGDPRWTQTITTGINEVKTAAESNDVWYNLQGVRVSQPVKGVYVSNGKKIVVK